MTDVKNNGSSVKGKKVQNSHHTYEFYFKIMVIKHTK
jgi:hypothetical protein